MSERMLSILAPVLLVAVAIAPRSLSADENIPWGDHPFDAEIDRARECLDHIDKNIQDYSCNFIKRERIDGKLVDYEVVSMRVRHKPFSVYMYFLSPDDVKGQQVAYVNGSNNNKLVAQPVGLKGKLGPYYLDPNGFLAMQNQRYPITECGIKILLERLVEEGMRERKFGETTVKMYKGAKVGDRVCTVTEVANPPRPHFQYAMARIYQDDELKVPIRFESYVYPENVKPGDKPLLLEEYTYTNFKFNNGFTDDDFTIRK